MVTGRTVFVLGAAANKEIDYTKSMPVGSELAFRIQQGISGELNTNGQWPSGPISDAISRQIGGISEKHVAALRRIEQGITFKESIDEFLDEWQEMPHLVECGKLAISHEILISEAKTQFSMLMKGEQGSALLFNSIRDSWLGQIFRFANPSQRRRDVQKCFDNISFITFNYDRCLEAGIYAFIRYGQNIPEDEAYDILQSIPILHVYGSLGELALPSKASGIPIGSTEHWSILRGSQGIRTFTEECDSNHKNMINFELLNASKIVFLGFGFNDRNLDLILPSAFGAANFALGTGIGLRREQRAAVERRMAILGTTIKLAEVQCSVLIDENRDSIFGL